MGSIRLQLIPVPNEWSLNFAIQCQWTTFARRFAPYSTYEYNPLRTEDAFFDHHNCALLLNANARAIMFLPSFLPQTHLLAVFGFFGPFWRFSGFSACRLCLICEVYVYMLHKLVSAIVHVRSFSISCIDTASLNRPFARWHWSVVAFIAFAFCVLFRCVPKPLR